MMAASVFTRLTRGSLDSFKVLWWLDFFLSWASGSSDSYSSSLITDMPSPLFCLNLESRRLWPLRSLFDPVFFLIRIYFGKELPELSTGVDSMRSLSKAFSS